MEWAGVIGLIGAISGIVLGWAGRAKSFKQEVVQEASIDAVLRTDVGYIKHSIDDVRMMQGQQGAKFEALTEKVIRVEESAKQAHKRIDDLKNERGN